MSYNYEFTWMYNCIYGKTGLSEALEQIYDKNAVFHMVQGKS